MYWNSELVDGRKLNVKEALGWVLKQERERQFSPKTSWTKLCGRLDANLENWNFPSVALSTPAAFSFTRFTAGSPVLFSQYFGLWAQISYLSLSLELTLWSSHCSLCCSNPCIIWHLEQYFPNLFATSQKLESCLLTEIATCIFKAVSFLSLLRFYEQVVTSSCVFHSVVLASLN